MSSAMQASFRADARWRGVNDKTEPRHQGRPRSPRLQRRQKALRAADQGKRSPTRANGCPFSTRLLEMLSDRFGAFEAIANSSIKRAR